MEKFKINIHLNDGTISRTNKIDTYHSNGRVLAWTDENGKRVCVGTEFIKKDGIEYNQY